MIRRTLACALAIAGATAFVAAPPARAPTALCASHGKRGFKKLSLPADQRKALLRSLTTETIRHGRITTTHTRAKEVQKHVDKMITLGKRGDLHARRLAHARLRDDAMTKKLFDVLGKRYEDRAGGYCRIMKAGFRYGDSAPMAVIELVDRDEDARGQDSGPVQVEDDLQAGDTAA